MLKKLLTLAIVPVVLSAFAQFGTMPLIEHSWNQIVDYQSPYTFPLPPGQGGEVVTNQVVLVVVDGLRADVSHALPVLNGLRGRGADLTLSTGQPSLSYPTWTTIGSGAWQETHGVTTNWYTKAVAVDTILARARAAGLSTAIAGSTGWNQLYAGQYDQGLFIPWEGETTDDKILAGALQMLKEDKPNLLIVHFEAVDEFGHAQGGASAEYRRVALAVDGRIGELAKALDLGSSVLAVTADHGHLDRGGHGGPEAVVTTVPFVVTGKGIAAGVYPLAAQADIAPTLAVLLGTAIPAHNQGEPLWDVLDLPESLRATRAVDVAAQLDGFYGAYARQIGAPAFDNGGLATARAALNAGDFATAFRASVDLSASLAGQAEGARSARLWRERPVRTPLALIVLLPFAAWLYLAWRRRWDMRLPLLCAAVYFVVYNGLYFAGGNSFSLSAFNSEDQLPAFFTQRGVDALIALLAAGVLAGVLSYRRDVFGSALAAVNTLFLIALGLALQVILFFWLWNVSFAWYLPDLVLGFKYYLDMIQTTAFYPKVYLPVAAILPLLAVGLRTLMRRLIPLPATTDQASQKVA